MDFLIRTLATGCSTVNSGLAIIARSLVRPDPSAIAAYRHSTPRFRSVSVPSRRLKEMRSIGAKLRARCPRRILSQEARWYGAGNVRRSAQIGRGLRRRLIRRW